jgi:mono/diheme cytochrome c family protein
MGKKRIARRREREAAGNARYGAFGLLVALGIGVVGAAALPRPAVGEEPPAAKPTPEQITFFENKVRPVLAESCYSCHGKDAQLGGLRLDSRAALLKGGDSGASLVPGDPEKSLFIQAVRHFGRLKMPQGSKLPNEKIEALIAWVKMGAPWPETRTASTS